MKSKTRVALAVLIPALLALPLLVAACGGEETTTTQPLTSSTQALTTTTDTSSSAAPSGNAPVGRSGGVMVFDPTSDRLIMFGGTSGDATLNETWAYYPSTNSWAELNPTGSLPPARVTFSMVWDPGTQRMIMFGGAQDVSLSNLVNDMWAYDPMANSWTDLRPADPPSARWGQAMVYDSLMQRVIMVGGQDANTGDLDDTWAYDPKANTWSELTPKGKESTTWVAHSMVYDPSSGRVIAFGGGGGGTTERNETWLFDPKASTWTKLSPSGTLPSPRAFSPMVYDPATKRGLIFGGLFGAGSGFLNDTSAYDPSTNAWTLLAPAGTLPSARSEQAMAYDPSTGLMIMFGGWDGSVRLNDTWTYDPKANTWSELTPEGPTATTG